jgi:hypothetical protein
MKVKTPEWKAANQYLAKLFENPRGVEDILLMSKLRDPVEKKRPAYERDHYNRGGQHDKGWRKIRPLKKMKARRAFRKASNDHTRSSAVEETTPTAAIRKHGGVKQRDVPDWGAMSLKSFVHSRLSRRSASVGAKKKRRASRSA